MTQSYYHNQEQIANIIIPHHFNSRAANNFPAYEYAICQMIRGSAAQTGIIFLTRETKPPPSSTPQLSIAHNYNKFKLTSIPFFGSIATENQTLIIFDNFDNG